mgnify:CR=1 FL=1
MSKLKDLSKDEIIKEYQINAKDSGSVELQIALLTYRINHLIEHMKKNKKDQHTKRGLLKLVGQRRKFIAYLEKKKPSDLVKLQKKLKLKVKTQ